MGYGHFNSSRSCCLPTRRRRSSRVVFGCSTPTFTVKIGEVVDVLIDMSDEAFGVSDVVTAAPTISFVSAHDGSDASMGVVSATAQPPERNSVEIYVNTQDMNLAAGEVFKVTAEISMSDGRAFLRCFNIRLRSCANGAVYQPHQVPESTPAAEPECGVIISGSGRTIPETASAGIFMLVPAPFGATYATIQFHTHGVWTVTGATPSDINSVGNQVAAGTTVTLQNRNEIDSFRFTGTNDGADFVHAFAEFYTSDPNC